MSILSKWTSGFKTTASKFRKDEGGNFTMLFAGASVMFLMAGGLALDTSRMFAAKAKLNNAIDAAVLATTRDLTTGVIAEADAEAAVANFIYTNMELGGFSPDDVKIDGITIDQTSKTVEIDAHLMLPMTLTAIAGYEKMRVASSTKAEYADDRIEIAMALDVTGSMGNSLASGQTRMEALKIAAQGAVDSLITSSGNPNRVRIGLVPYSASVNVSPFLSKIHHTDETTACVAERTTSKKYSADRTTPGHPVMGVDLPTSNSSCPSNPIVPMTSNIDTLTNTIASFKTDGYTAGHTGIAWAQYLLSSDWNNVWPAASHAAESTNSNTKKFAIILTDGRFNTFLSNGKGRGNGAAQSTKYAKGLCDNMKDGNITVFTINFDGGSDAEQLMKKCATPDTASEQFFFNADDASELNNAFDSIAKAINTLRLVG